MRQLRGNIFYILIGIELSLVFFALGCLIIDLQTLGIMTQGSEDAILRVWNGLKLLITFWLGAKYGVSK